MKVSTLSLTLLFASLPAVSQAQIIKCKDPSGRIIFQSTPCAADKSAPDVPRPVAGTRDERFSQRQKSTQPDANWDTVRAAPLRTPTPGRPSAAPMPAAERAPKAVAASAAERQVEKSYAQKRQDEETKTYNDRVAANNKQNECNRARQQLGVAKSGRPIFSYDNKGERQFMADEQRAAHESAAAKSVAQACN